MRRPLAVIAVVLALSGCKGTTPAASPVDPFFGRTRIEPPGTGVIAVPGAKDPSYTAPAMPRSGGVPRPTSMGSNVQPSSSAAAALQESVSKTPGTQRGLQRGEQVAIPVSARGATALVASVGGSARAGGQLVAPQKSSGFTGQAAGSTIVAQGSTLPQKIVQTISPRPQPVGQSRQDGTAASLPSTWPSPQPVTAPQNTVNIMDLPAPPVASGSQSSATAPASGVVATSASEEVVAKARDRYAHDSEYQRLRGRLEYSQIDRAWRLRYIPVDGVTDAYGGSVVLAQTPKLSGFQRGNMVEVHGRLVPPQAGATTFAAGYEISDIKQLGP